MMNDGYGIIVYCYVCWNKQKYLKIVIIAAYVVHHLSLRPLYNVISDKAIVGGIARSVFIAKAVPLRSYHFLNYNYPRQNNKVSHCVAL